MERPRSQPHQSQRQPRVSLAADALNPADVAPEALVADLLQGRSEWGIICDEALPLHKAPATSHPSLDSQETPRNFRLASSPLRWAVEWLLKENSNRSGHAVLNLTGKRI